MSKDLHQYVGQRSRYDLVLAVRSMAYTIGWLIADLPIELRERCFEAVLKDAMDTENTIRIAGLDGRAVEIDKKKNSIETPKRRNEKLW